MYHILIEHIEAKAISQAQRIFRRLGGQIAQVSDLIITDNIPLYTQCYVHAYNKILKKEMKC